LGGGFGVERMLSIVRAGGIDVVRRSNGIDVIRRGDGIDAVKRLNGRV
jgi:hypothetical protein